jgi:lysophospholipase L1-like esterase
MHSTRHASAAMLLAAAVLALAGCAPSGAVIENTPVTFAVAGDSLTAWDNQSFPDWDGELDDTTWTKWAISPTLELIGGYARGFAMTADVAQNMPVVDADVLVLMVSTNDLDETDIASVLGSVDDIVTASGVDSVVLSAIPPFEDYAALVGIHNDALSALASERGWVWIDPWVDLRDGDGWVDGSTSDGVHPTADAAKVAGTAIAAAIRALAERG